MQKYLLLILGMISGLLISSCEKSQEELKTETQHNATFVNESASKDSKNNSVNFISQVSPVQKGIATDFIWTENGQTKSFSQETKNKVVFLNFWGTWCPPCRKEIPDIIKLQKDLKNKDFVVMGIALERGKDQIENKAKVSSYADNKGINYKNFIAIGELVEAYGGINNVPTTFLIDRDGKIRERIVGARSYEAFMQSINRIL